MSFITGTASGYLGLLTTLDNFLTSTGHCWGLEFVGVGNGRLVSYIGTAGSVAETITCTASNSSTFAVSGSVSGSLGTATVGAAYSGSKCAFTIQAGSQAFVAGDYFRFNTSPRWIRDRLQGVGELQTDRTSSFGAGSAIASLFDDSLATGYSTSAPAWVRINCPYPTIVKSWSLGCLTGSLAPQNFELQSSNDGSVWTTVQALTSQTGWGNNTTRYFTPSSPPSALYWRIYISASNGATLSLSNARFFGNVAATYSVDQRIEAIWRAPGVDGTQQIYIPAYTYIDESQDIYNLCFRGYRFDDALIADQSITNQIGSGTVAMCLRDVPIVYWIVAHGGRVMIMTKHTGLYQFAYLGYGLPYETPSSHPYPCIIAAPSNSISRKYDSTSGDYQNVGTAGVNTVHAFSPAGNWRPNGNYWSDGGLGGQAYGRDNGVILPTARDANADPLGLIRTNLDGSLPMLPLVIRSWNPEHMWGEFDGVMFTTGFDNSTESLTRRGQIDWISFPSVFRTGMNFWIAMALD